MEVTTEGVVLDLGLPSLAVPAPPAKPTVPPPPPPPAPAPPVSPALAVREETAPPPPPSVSLPFLSEIAPPPPFPAARQNPPPAPPPAAGTPKVLTPPAVEPGVPEDQLLRAAVFYSPQADAAKQKFLSTLMDMTQKKAKKPIFLRPVLSHATTISTDNTTEWVWLARSAGADVMFVILPPDLLPDFMESIVTEARQAGLYCFLVPQAEISSRLFYVDLMVELMLVKRKK
jgi:hypothetical protein